MTDISPVSQDEEQMSYYFVMIIAKNSHDAYTKPVNFTNCRVNKICILQP